MEIRRYDSIITIIDSTKRAMLALKFKIINNKLYAFNYYLPLENRKMVEVTQINGVSVDTFIKNIDENDFYNIQKMKQVGIDTTNSFICTLTENENQVNFDVFDFADNEDIFYKSHEIKLINRDILSLSGINKIENFDKNEFYLDSTMGKIEIKGKNLEVLLLDTDKGDVKIKGKIYSIIYSDYKKDNKESIFTKLFK